MEKTKPRQGLPRRVVLKLGGSVVLPHTGCGGSSAVASGDLRGPPGPTPLVRFLSDAECATLRGLGLVDRLIPGDLVPGAADAEADVSVTGDLLDALIGLLAPAEGA